MQEELLLKRPHGSLQRMYVGSDHSHKSRLIEIEIGRYGRYVITETFCASALGRGRRWVAWRVDGRAAGSDDREVFVTDIPLCGLTVARSVGPYVTDVLLDHNTRRGERQVRCTRCLSHMGGGRVNSKPRKL